MAVSTTVVPAADPAAPEATPRSRRAARKAEPWVDNEVPLDPPITADEIALLRTYLGDVIDTILRGDT